MKKIILYMFLISSLAASVWAQEANKITKDVLTKTSSTWDGSALPNYPDGTPEVTILRFVIPPKSELPMHKHPVINAGIILTGELTVVTEDNKSIHLKAGDTLVELVNKWHHGKNEGTEPVEIIVFYAGIKDMPITILKETSK